MKKQLNVKDFSRMQKRRKAMELDVMIHWDFEHDNGEDPRARELAMTMVEQFPALRKNGTGLFLYGGPRAGKSYMAAEIVNALTDRGYKCYMTSLLGLFNCLSNRNGEMRSRLLEALFELDLLVLDDFGLQAGTQLNDQTLLYIVTTCQKLRIPLIVITHHSPDELMAAGKDGKPPVLVSHIRRCALDFNVIMPAARRRRMLQMKKDTRQMLHADANANANGNANGNGNANANANAKKDAPVQQELPLKE